MATAPDVAFKEVQAPPVSFGANLAHSALSSFDHELDVDAKAALGRSVKKFADQKFSRPDVTHSEEPSLYAEKILIDIPGMFDPRPIKGLSVNTLQEWRGVVKSIYEDYLTAELVDLTAAPAGREFADIPLREIDPSDRKSLTEGAIFHLLIGFTRRPGGNYGRETLIYFRKHAPSRAATPAKVAELLDEFGD